MGGIFGKMLAQADPHQKEAERALTHLSNSFDELFKLRAQNQQALSWKDRSCVYSPEEMKQRLEAFRDPEMEDRFRREYYKLMQTIYRREPTQLELQAGPPSGEGLGIVPLLGIAAIVAGGAWGLSSVTDYLSRQERLARGIVDEPTNWGRLVTNVIKGVTVAGVVGGASYGAYRLWGWAREKPKAPEAPAAQPAASEPATGDEEE